jgi:hypothetical protein
MPGVPYQSQDGVFYMGMIRPAMILVLLSSFWGSHLLAGDPIAIDGFFEDWASVPVAYSDGQEGLLARALHNPKTADKIYHTHGPKTIFSSL